MAKPKITANDLETAASARFYVLPKPLTAMFVKELFATILRQYGAKRASPAQVRVQTGADANLCVHSFLCYSWEAPVTFLKSPVLKTKQHGFILLIERAGHLAVFYKGGGGFDSYFGPVTTAVPRQKLTHAWGDKARYQKLGTRRMTISRQELRGASYDAEDLESALPPAVASRSIPQSLRLVVDEVGSVAITPSTGRVQKSGGKGVLADLVEFIDETLEQINRKQVSPFLRAFPSPLELHELPRTVAPTGLLIDLALLHDATIGPDALFSLSYSGNPPMSEEQLQTLLAPTRSLVADDRADEWVAAGEKPAEPFARIRLLKHSFKLSTEALGGWEIEENVTGIKFDLLQWLRAHDGFSLTFSEPDYFYTGGSLYQRAGFAAEMAQVKKLLHVHAALDGATSEKGKYKQYTAATHHFDADSIFSVVETSLAADDTQLCCGDLGDEWADYLGFTDHSVSFYHCKDGDPTTGASDFQIVIGQALKNLSRVRFRSDEIREKLEMRRQTAHWGKTAIPLLVRPATDWTALIATARAAASAPDTIWNVALVVTALSAAEFEREAARATPRPNFIQLVWLLSAFASGCAERGARPLVYCRT